MGRRQLDTKRHCRGLTVLVITSADRSTFFVVEDRHRQRARNATAMHLDGRTHIDQLERRVFAAQREYVRGVDLSWVPWHGRSCGVGGDRHGQSLRETRPQFRFLPLNLRGELGFFRTHESAAMFGFEAQLNAGDAKKHE